MAQSLRPWSHHVCRGDCVLCLRPTKLRVGDTVDFVAFLELSYSRTNYLHHARQIGAEGKRWLWTHLTLTLTNQCVPWTNSSSGHAHEELSRRWNRTRHIFHDNYLESTKTMDSSCFHLFPIRDNRVSHIEANSPASIPPKKDAWRQVRRESGVSTATVMAKVAAGPGKRCRVDLRINCSCSTGLRKSFMCSSSCASTHSAPGAQGRPKRKAGISAGPPLVSSFPLEKVWPSTFRSPV
jgi:hypothetical protein